MGMKPTDEEKQGERPQYVADAGGDRASVRFIRRIACLVARSKPTQVVVAPVVWNDVAYETNFGSVPGSRLRDHIEVLTLTGWLEIRVDLNYGAVDTVLADVLGETVLGRFCDERGTVLADLDFADVTSRW